MNLKSLSAWVLLLNFGGAGLAAVAAEGGGMTFEEKLQTCSACHGENGDKPLAPDYPILAGQYQTYLAHALQAYRSGTRTNPIMSMQVQSLGLSDEDIEKLARHFAEKDGLKSLGH